MKHKRSYRCAVKTNCWLQRVAHARASPAQFVLVIPHSENQDVMKSKEIVRHYIYLEMRCQQQNRQMKNVCLFVISFLILYTQSHNQNTASPGRRYPMLTTSLRNTRLAEMTNDFDSFKIAHFCLAVYI